MFLFRLSTPVLFIAILCAGSVACAQQTSSDLQQRGIEAWRTNDLPAAESDFRSALKQNPNNATSLAFLAAVLDRQGKLAEADPFYSRALKLAPQSVPLWNNYGNHCAQQGQDARARKAFLHVLTVDPNHRNALLQLARIDIRSRNGAAALRSLSTLGDDNLAVVLLRAEATHLTGDTPTARHMIDDLARAHDSDASVLLACGLLLNRMGDFSDARKILSQAVVLSPGDADAQRALGVAEAQGKDYADSVQALTASIKIRPDDPETLADLGRVDAARGDYAHAILPLSQARKLAPRDASVLLPLARALDTVGDLVYADQVYTELIALDPGNDAVRLDRALDDSATGKYTRAMAEIDRYIRRHPRDAQGYYRRALVVERNSSAEALKALHQALQINPSFTEARFERALFLIQAGEPKTALADLEFCARARPDDPEILAQLGRLMLELKQPAEAETVLTKAAALDPTNRAVLMHLGKALEKNGKPDEAKKVFAQLEALGPEAQHGDQSATIIEMINLPPSQRLDATIARLQKAAERTPDNVAVHIQLAEALADAGRKDEAAAVLNDIPPALRPLPTAGGAPQRANSHQHLHP